MRADISATALALFDPLPLFDTVIMPSPSPLLPQHLSRPRVPTSISQWARAVYELRTRPVSRRPAPLPSPHFTPLPPRWIHHHVPHRSLPTEGE